MQYAPPASGFLSGFEKGIDLHRKLFELPKIEEEERAHKRRQREREEEEYRQRIDDRLEQKRKGIRQEESARIKEQLGYLDNEQETLARQAAALQSQYGTEIPPEQKVALGRAFKVLQDKRESLMSRAEKLWKEIDETGRKALGKLNSGSQNVSERELLSSVAITGYDPRLLVQVDPSLPSPLQKAIIDVHEAMESGNFEKAADAANLILSPELRKGVGSPGADGTTITRKEIVGFVPAPDGNRVSPVLRVYTVGNPQGYIAPVTKNRTSDPDDEPVFLSMDDLLDRVGKVQQLAELFSAPAMQQKLQEGLKRSSDDIDVALQYFGRIPLPKNISGLSGRYKVENVRRGDKIDRIVMDRLTGEIVSREEVPVSVSPDVAARNKTTREVAAIRAASSAGSRAQTQASGGGSAQQRLTNRDIEALVENAASKLGVFKEAGKWYRLVDKGGRKFRDEPAEDELKTINQIRAGITSYSRSGAKGTEQGRVYTSPSELPPPKERSVGQPFNLNGRLHIWMGSGWLPLD